MDKPQEMEITKGNGYPHEFREEAVRYRWHKEMEAVAPLTGQATSVQTTESSNDQTEYSGIGQRERSFAPRE